MKLGEPRVWASVGENTLMMSIQGMEVNLLQNVFNC